MWKVIVTTMFSIKRNRMKKNSLYKHLKNLGSVCHELMSLLHISDYISYNILQKHIDMGAHLGLEKRCYQ